MENKKASSKIEKKESKKDIRNNKITELEKQISTTKYNKKTQHAIGLMKAQLASLKEKALNVGKGQKKGDGWSVRKSGDATVVLLGFPSVGKSTLLNAITNADSQIGHYAFTTLTCIPGTLEYRGAKIQVLDVPGIVEGAAAGTGRGKEVLQAVRNADLILIVLDIFYPGHYQKIIKEVRDVGVRMNQSKPDVRIRKTIKGGIDVGSTVKLTKLTKETIIGMMKAMGYINASIVLREDIDADQLLDIIEENKVYIPAVTIVNKVDMATPAQIEFFKKEFNVNNFVSAQKKEHIEELKELIFNGLSFVRLYLKEVGKKADMKEPLIMTSPCTLRSLCTKLHKDFATKFKFSRIWGKSVRFDGQKIVKLTHQLQDEDIVELHMR